MRLPFAPEAVPFALPPFLVGLALQVPGPPWPWVGIALLLLGLLVLAFFRDPHRRVPSEPDVAVSPADGRVMRASALEPGEEAPEGAESVLSIFLSITDVHINRAPVEGRIERVEYRPGRYRAAYRPEASRENERNEVGLSSGHGPVTFRQIAGLVARRIVFRHRVGDLLRRGQRVGLIRFGSRTDLFLGAGWSWTVRPGDRVRGGETVVARRTPTP